MSTAKVKKIKRQIQYTATWASGGGGVLTVTTASAHYLTSGDVVSLIFNDSPQLLPSVVATVTNSTVFTVPCATINLAQTVGLAEIAFYGSAQTGAQAAFTLPRGQGSGNMIIQSYVTGTGGATYTLELSLDNAHWITSVATVTHAGTTNDTAFIAVDPAWAYARLNISALPAGTQLSVLVSG